MKTKKPVILVEINGLALSKWDIFKDELLNSFTSDGSRTLYDLLTDQFKVKEIYMTNSMANKTVNEVFK